MWGFGVYFLCVSCFVFFLGLCFCVCGVCSVCVCNCVKFNTSLGFNSDRVFMYNKHFYVFWGSWQVCATSEILGAKIACEGARHRQEPYAVPRRGV